MMRPPFCGPRRRPPWWPENEPWPPRPWTDRRGAPPRFVRRFAAIACTMMAVLLIAAATTTWHGPRPFAAATGFLIAVCAMAIVGALFGGIAMPIGGILDAIHRVASGDYDVRVRELGPPRMRAVTRAFNTMTRRLKDHDRMRRNLMADVAHELRTPLTVMQGTLEGLLDGVYPRDDAHVRRLLEETQVLARLVEDLRTLALSESGALTLQKESVDLSSLVRDVAGGFASPAADRRVVIAVEAPDTVAPIEVDPVRMRQVTANLLSNALRATPAGGRVTIRVAGADGGVSVEVRDTGRGMTSEELARAFDRFYKGADSRGSGLGLTIARNLVEAHGGRISASSAAGEGTTVSVTLPTVRL